VVNEFSGASIPNEEAEKAYRAIQFTRLGRNEDIAGMALYLACADSEFMSGHSIPMDGGASVRGSLPTLDILSVATKE
jgi:NAD(P)-dependent dehydrogenase (short-subunit alcohol dehydrogenase family)